MNFFHVVLYQPMLNMLIWLYHTIPGSDIGFAIIALTIVVKMILWPLSHSSLKSQKALQDLQPKMDALKEQFKGDKEGLAKAMMELYAKEKVSPLSSCLPLIIQLPILIALYQVLGAGISTVDPADLYGFVQNPGTINHLFLGILNLSEKSIFLAIAAGVLQYFQTKMLTAKRPPVALRAKPGAKDEDMLTAMNKSMTLFMPIMTMFIGFSLPGGLALYWVALNIITIIQQVLVFRKKKEAAPYVNPT